MFKSIKNPTYIIFKKLTS